MPSGYQLAAESPLDLLSHCFDENSRNQLGKVGVPQFRNQFLLRVTPH